MIKLRKQMDPNLLLRGGTQGSHQHCELLKESSVVDPDSKLFAYPDPDPK